MWTLESILSVFIGFTSSAIQLVELERKQLEVIQESNCLQYQQRELQWRYMEEKKDK